MFIWLQGDSEADTFITMRILSGDTKDALLMNDFTIYTILLYLSISNSLTYTIISGVNIPQRFLHHRKVSPFIQLATILYLLRHKVSVLLTLCACSGLAGLT